MISANQRLAGATDYITAIDGLRAIAVIAIILFHIDNKYCPGGFLGVDIFFVISGFVVAQSASRLSAASLGQFLTLFFRRRILRIYPALLVFIILISFMCIILLPNVPDTNYIIPTGFAAFFGVSNIFLWYISNDYFSPANGYNLFLHTWSLGVEEQYYIIFPFLSYFIFKGSKNLRSAGYFVLVSMFLLSLCMVTLTKSNLFNFYMTPSRFWELGFGFLLFLHREHLSQPFQRSQIRLHFLSFFGIVLIAFALSTEQSNSLSLGSLVACLGSACVMLASCCGDSIVGRALSVRLPRLIGKMSYSLYLWHWSVVVAIKWGADSQNIETQVFSGILIILLSISSYFLIEIPCRKSSQLRELPTSKFLLLFASAMIAGVFAVVGGLAGRTTFGVSATNNLAVWSTTSRPVRAAGDCEVNVTSLSRAGGRFITFNPSECIKKDHKQHQIFIVGDSHAGAYWRLNYNLAMRYGMRTEIITKGGCATLILAPISQGEGCASFRSQMLQEITSNAKRGDTVMLTALYIERFRNAFQDIPVKLSAREQSPVSPISDVDFVISTILKTGAKVVLDAPQPVLKTAQFRCADAYLSHSAYCFGGLTTFSKDQLEQIRLPALEKMREISSRYADVRVWDSFNLLCPNVVCVGYSSREPLFYDTDHLTGFGNDLLTPYFFADLLAASQD